MWQFTAYHFPDGQFVSSDTPLLHASYPIVAITSHFGGTEFSAKTTLNLSGIMIGQTKHSKVLRLVIGVILVYMMDLDRLSRLIANTAGVIVLEEHFGCNIFWDRNSQDLQSYF
jgi:hypothetical protein